MNSIQVALIGMSEWMIFLLERFVLSNIFQQKQDSMDKGRSASDFQIIGRLGQGAFGQVFKVKRKETGQIYAMKKIKTVTMKEKDRANALNEIRILASMEGNHIIGYKDSFYDEGSANLCIVLQFAGQGDIMKKINEHSKKKKFIDEAQIWKAMVQIGKGIQTLHDNNVLHRDLKSANIFITDDGTYKLGDLNISKVVKHGLARTQTGTPYYCSPEVWQDKPYGAKSDMWSFGCVLYEMCAQKPPFTATDIQGLYRKICAGVFPRIPNHYSNELADIISSLLKLNPSLRPSTYELLKNPVVRRRCGEDIALEPEQNNGNLLGTIQFNNKGWKNLNSNLPKSKYECAEQEDSDIDKMASNQLLNVPLSRPTRPLSTGSSKKYIQNNYSYRNRSNQKQSNAEDEPAAPAKGARVLSAYGKNRNPSIAGTPDRSENKNQLVLPPIDPSKRKSRRGSDVDLNCLPPRPNELKSRNNSSEQKPGSREKLQRAGLQALNNGVQNHIPYQKYY